jgi:hypothetical protein
VLTQEEQMEVIEEVKKIIRNDRSRNTRVKTGSMSEKVAKEAEKRDLQNLHYLLKDIG